MPEVFKIPVYWEMYGEVDITAESIEEAIQLFDKTVHDIELPTEQSYLDGSFHREEGDPCVLNNCIAKYKNVINTFSIKDNPNWDMQEKLMEIGTRYHLG